MENVDAVDFGGGGDADGEGDGAFADEDGESLAGWGVEDFGVIEAADAFIGIEDDSGGVDGAEEAAAA